MSIGLVPSLPSSAPVPAGHELATADVLINAGDYPTLKDAFDAATAWRGYMDGYKCTLNLDSRVYTDDDKFKIDVAFFPELYVVGKTVAIAARDDFELSSIDINIAHNTDAEESLVDQYFLTRIFDVKIAFKDDSGNFYDFSASLSVGDRIALTSQSFSYYESVPVAALIFAPGVVYAVDNESITIRHRVTDAVATDLQTSPATIFPLALVIPASIFDYFAITKYETIIDCGSATHDVSSSEYMCSIVNSTIGGISGIMFSSSVVEGHGHKSLLIRNSSLCDEFYVNDLAFIALDESASTVSKNVQITRSSGILTIRSENVSTIRINDQSTTRLDIYGILIGSAIRVESSSVPGVNGIAYSTDAFVTSDGDATINAFSSRIAGSGSFVLALGMSRVFVPVRSDGVAIITYPEIGVMSSTGSGVYSY